MKSTACIFLSMCCFGPAIYGQDGAGEYAGPKASADDSYAARGAFSLQFHNEERVRLAYVLTRGKRPLKLQESSSRQRCRWTPLEAGMMRRECQGMSMAEVARQLPGWGPDWHHVAGA